MALRLTSSCKPLSQIRKASALASAQDVLASTNKASLTELKNGFRVTSVENNRPLTTIGVWIDAGSRYETNYNNGISSFVEHLLYHGTNSRSKIQIENDLAKLGARLNSYTSRECTAYFVQVPNAQVEKAIDILANILRGSKFEESAVENERQVLLRKIQDSDSNLTEVVMNNLHATAFQGTTFSLSTLGNTQSLQNILRQDLVKYAEDHFKPVRMVLAGVGGITHEQLTNFGEKYFGDLNNNYERKVADFEGVRFTGSEFRYRDDSMPFLYGAVAVEGVPASNPDALPLQIASTLVGQYDRTQVGYNSPNKLVQRLADECALDSYQSFNLNYNSTGLFGFQFSAHGEDNEEILSIISKIQKEWKHLSVAVTDDEVDRAKQQLKSDLLSITDDSTKFADVVARDVLNTGKPTHLDELERAIHKIDAACVREAMSRNVYDRDIACAAIGRSEAWPNYAQLRYGMSFWRL